MPLTKTRLLSPVIALLLLTAPLSVHAIDEVTPTPTPADVSSPAEPTAAPPVEATPTATPLPDSSGEEVNAEQLLNEAIADLQSGDAPAAIEKMDRLIAAQPDNAEAYFVRAVAHGQLNDYAAAISNLDSAIEIRPWSWEFHTFRGDAYQQQGEAGTALFDYDRAVYLNPRYTPAFQGRSRANSTLGDTLAAEIDDLIATGLSRASNGNSTAAREFFTEAINTDADLRSRSAAYYNRASLSLGSGEYQDAIDDYTEALNIFPDMHDSYLARGIAYRESERIREAGEDFLNRMELLENQSFEETLSVGSSTEVEMAYGNVYRIQFDAQAGQSLTLTARDAEGVAVDPLIALLDPSGTPIAGDDDFGGNLDSQIEAFEITESGTYTLVVSHANGGFDGVVNISVAPGGSST